MRGPMSARCFTVENFDSKNLHGLEQTWRGIADAMFSLGWAALYGGVALLAAAMVLVFADRLYSQDPAYRPVGPGLALAAGALWPVLVIGAAQLLVLQFFRGRRREADAAVVEIAAARRAAATAEAVKTVPVWRISA